MELQYIHLAIAVGIGILIGYLFAKTLVGDLIYQERKDATKQSRKVILGEVNEKIAPMLPGFPYNYKDLVFIGKGNVCFQNIILIYSVSALSTGSQATKSIAILVGREEVIIDIECPFFSWRPDP
jgi:hypothetical protein